ncbi:MAG TPA: DUF2950 domain-containing protein [Verrucomicrobiae bacterium]|nr:DUF2950 domain-containing protein [Verrucomicrobiae bacterium]
MTPIKLFFHAIGGHELVFALALWSAVGATAAETSRTFASPEAAVAALVTAVDSQDASAIRDLFGPVATELENRDEVQAANEHIAFARALNKAARIARQSESRCVLEVGDQNWPFPIPIIKRDGQWFFDTEAGKEELLNRRIGRNELATLAVMRACVQAQREYATRDHDDDEVLEFAQKFISTPGTKDGLYWPPDLDGEISPLGPLVANAQRLGYKHQPQDPQPSPEPFHGYFFKVLTSQGKHAPGGKHTYIINGNMIAGFAFVAWPASYGESGIMTFIVNQQGRVYQKDLGQRTIKSAASMQAYDPDDAWAVSPD